ncbi:MAG: hypothetical protein ACD_28C00207G0006, partial [uncultured bacterium]
ATKGLDLALARWHCATNFPKELTVETIEGKTYIVYGFRSEKLSTESITSAAEIDSWKANLDKKALSSPQVNIGKEFAQAFTVNGVAGVIGIAVSILLISAGPYLSKAFNAFKPPEYGSIDDLLSQRFKIANTEIATIKGIKMVDLLKFFEESQKETPNYEELGLEEGQREALQKFQTQEGGKTFKLFRKELMSGKNGNASTYKDQTDDLITLDQFLQKRFKNDKLPWKTS